VARYHKTTSMPSTKRQRPNTNADSAAAPFSRIPNAPPTNHQYRVKLQSILDTFNEQTLRETLFTTALKHENVFSLLTNCYTDTICRQSTRIINFDHNSDSVWHELLQGRGLTGSRQYDLGGDVVASIAGTTTKILERTPAHASFETKKSALETLRKMGKSIALGGIRYLGFRGYQLSVYRRGAFREGCERNRCWHERRWKDQDAR